MEHCETIIKKKYRDEGSLPMYCHWNEQIKLELVLKKRGEHFLSSKECAKPVSIYYEDIFTKPLNGREKEVRRVLIEGGTGTGKTMFCISVTKRWANGYIFQQFKLLLFLPLCQLLIGSISSLSELIESLMLQINPQIVASELQQKNGEGVLIVADGWNDLSESKRLEGSFLYKLLFGNILQQASVIVTSRHTASAPLHKNAFVNRFVEICGFNIENIKKCIQSDHANDGQADYILEKIYDNPLIQSMCSIPLCCTTICHMSHSPNKGLPATMTDLCTKIVMKILCHSVGTTDTPVSISSLPEIDHLPQKLQDMWWRLCKLAFQTIEKSQVDLSQFQSFQYGIELTGLVEFVPDRDNNIVSVSFLHSTFHRYLAAVHVVKQPADTQLKALNRELVKFRELFDFWQYFFGLNVIKEHKLLKLVIHKQAKDNGSKCLLCQCAFEAEDSSITSEVIKSLSTKVSRKTIIHFGDSHTVHDCEAILYVIASIQGSECDGIIINFKASSLNAKQIIKFADILATKPSTLQVKELDLSDNNLQDNCIAELFATALPAFHSLEKLYLRNNKIVEEGICTIMKALSSHKLTQLDLSFNCLTQAGLYVLQNAVKSGTLTNLEILFLQGALTTDATVNIQFFCTFSEALLSQCPHLRILDLSSNDFGEPERPTISSIIMQVSTKKIDLRLNREYMSDVDKSFITIMKDSIKRKGTIDHTVAHVLIVGPGRSGKNSLMNRLMGEAPPDPKKISPSTGVLENIVKVEVQKQCTVAAAVNNLQWKRLDYDE